jgi:peptidoglycan/LPS O-acetylase OafA/YrhL
VNYNKVRQQKEILPLTGIRAFAAWWVVLFHTAYALPAALAGLFWFSRLGYLGVDLFFVLSGFVISYNYWQRFSKFSYKTYRRFLWLRLARLYPVHLFTLILSALLLAGVRVFGFTSAKNFSTWTLENFLANVLLVHSWRPYCIESWNNASWSVSCEWFVYLVFPLLVLTQLKRLPVPVLYICALLLSAIPVAFTQMSYSLPCFLLLNVLCEFTAGCFVYHAYMHRREDSRVGRKFAYGVVVALIFVLALIWKYRSINPYWLALLFPFVILAVAESSGLLGNIVGSKIAVYWGKVSYSLYMTHNVTLWLLKAFLPIHPGWKGDALYFIYIASIGIVAALTYHLVEEPARKWMRARGQSAVERDSNTRLRKQASSVSIP